MIHDWIDRLPLASRLFQAIGFLAWGVAIQAGFEWQQAATDHDRSWYRLLTFAAIFVGAAFIVCDLKLRREQGKSASFISDRMEEINKSLGVTRPEPPPKRKWWKWL
jgi:hypothetical protein